MPGYYADMTKKMSKAEKSAYGNYETQERAESDVHTLMEAEMIKKDKARHRMAMKCAKMKQHAMQEVVEG